MTGRGERQPALKAEPHVDGDEPRPVRLVSSQPAAAGPTDEAPAASPKPTRSLPPAAQVAILILLAAGAGGAYVWQKRSAPATTPAPAPAAQTAQAPAPFVPTAAQLATFTVATVEARSFQVEQLTEGKIGPDEDRTTPIFSPYSGRVIRLVARQGQVVAPGETLFTVQATDMVQAQTDIVNAGGVVNKARSQLQLAQTVERRQRELFESKAVALRDLQAAQNDLVAAQNDLRAAEGALEAVRNRLTILGKSEAEIGQLLERGRISAEAPIVSPIGGTVISRRIGPGQYVSGGSGEPAYTVGDLSSVWLLANVREADAPALRVGQGVRFRVLAFPEKTFSASVTYVGASIDPATRRITVRAQVDNRDGLLKPEMFASVSIATGEVQTSPAVPREAVIYEGDTARVWVLQLNGAVELRAVTTGLLREGVIQVSSGVSAGERVISRGSLFIDRLATGGP